MQTGIQEQVLETFWEALIHMWNLDHSASRGRLACRGLYVFKHESSYGNAPSHLLFEKVDIKNKTGKTAPRSYKDYEVFTDKVLPEGVTLHSLINW